MPDAKLRVEGKLGTDTLWVDNALLLERFNLLCECFDLLFECMIFSNDICTKYSGLPLNLSGKPLYFAGTLKSVNSLDTFQSILSNFPIHSYWFNNDFIF